MPPASASPDPRRRAAEILARVDAGGAWAGRLLGDAAGLTRELVLGTLRWQRTLDFVLAPALRRPVEALDPLVRAVLRQGLYEARRLRTPVPVAVAEAVRVARALAPRAAGLVNAVLRRSVAAAWPDAADPTVPLGLRLSHPDWLVARWERLLGPEAAARTLAADQTPAPLCLLGAAGDAAALAAAGCELAPHAWAPGLLVVREGAREAAAALAAGHAYAMDAGAVAVARLLPEAPGPRVELAAAPGGKSLLLALERGGRGVAADRHAGRVALMRRTLGRLGAACGVLVADATAPPLRPGSVAAVLLDAPCSGTGTLRRHPEIRWRLAEGDLAGLGEMQARLLAGAVALLAPGGALLYATCSLEPEENAAVIATSALRVEPLADRLPPAAPRVELSSGGVVIPPGPGNDGFTVHLLRSG